MYVYVKLMYSLQAGFSNVCRLAMGYINRNKIRNKIRNKNKVHVYVIYFGFGICYSIFHALLQLLELINSDFRGMINTIQSHSLTVTIVLLTGRQCSGCTLCRK